MRSRGWALAQCDWGPYKKRRSGHRHTQRDDPVRTQGEDGCLQAEERGLRRTQPCPHLDLGFQPPGLETKNKEQCCCSHPRKHTLINPAATRREDPGGQDGRSERT